MVKQDDVFQSLDTFKIVEARHSVRTFSEEEPGARPIAVLREYCKNSETPFGNDVKLMLVSAADVHPSATEGKGTYGVIKGAKYFLLATVSEKAEFALVQVGYAVERAILFATALGLSGCILGGTFKGEQFSPAAKMEEGEILPLVVAIGMKAKKKRLSERFLRHRAKSDQRFELEDIAFDSDFENPLNHLSAGKLYPAFEAVRLAPSAKNNQPWRMVREGKKVHFYKYMSGNVRGSEFDLEEVDMGIAMCHFALVAADEGIRGEFTWKIPYIETEPSCDFVATFRPEMPGRSVFTVEIPEEGIAEAMEE